MAGAMAFFLAGCGTEDGKNGRQSRLVCTFGLEATVGSGERGAQRTRHLSAGSVHAAYSVPFDRHARGERFPLWLRPSVDGGWRHAGSLEASSLAEEVSRADKDDGGPEVEKNAEIKNCTDRA